MCSGTQILLVLACCVTVCFDPDSHMKQLHGARIIILALEHMLFVWQPHETIKADLFPYCVPADTHNSILRRNGLAASCGGLISSQDAACLSPQ